MEIVGQRAAERAIIVRLRDAARIAFRPARVSCGSDAVVIGIGALLVLGGISFFIWRDARKRAPVRQRPATAAAGGGSGPRQRPQKNRKLSAAEKRRRKRGKAR